MANMIPFPEHLTKQTYATIREAFDRSKDWVTETGRLGNINISSILTKLIQNTGRFVESYASDLLCGIDHIRELCDNRYPLTAEIDEIFVFGLRRSGVDHGNYVMSRLAEQVNPFQPYLHTDRVYRRVLAVRVHVFHESGHTEPNITCELRNITDHFLCLNPADLDADNNLIHGPYPDRNPIPVDTRAKKEGAT